MNNNIIIITGSAGFIGFNLVKKLLEIKSDSMQIIGIDNINDYYSVNLKYDRLAESGIKKELISYGREVLSTLNKNYKFIQVDLGDKESIEKIFEKYNPDQVIHLAAQVGVRYSIKEPYKYLSSNIIGFLNILESCKKLSVKHIIYASSSSVYGANIKYPYSITDNVDNPISFYAVTKKSNELMAHYYSHLYKIPTTGLRFFTVYGPWGRPDMAIFKFTKAIINNSPIDVYNYGKMERDFTYIEDIVEGIIRIIDKPPLLKGQNQTPYKIYNIGNNVPVCLNEIISILEGYLGIKAKINLLPIQPGDVIKTFADIDDLIKDFQFKPQTNIIEGIGKFVYWYKSYYKTSCSGY